MTARGLCWCGYYGEVADPTPTGVARRPDPHAGQAAAENVRAYAASLKREGGAYALLSEAAGALQGTRLSARIVAWLREVDAADRQARIDDLAFEAGDDDEARRGAQEA